MLKKIDNEKLIITQANALALSAQKMTLQEKRLLLLLISYVRAEDDEFKVYHLPVSDIKDYLELNGRSIYSKLQSVCRKLMGQVLFIEDGYGGWEMNQLVSKSKYVTARKSEDGVAHLQMRLHEDLRPLLLNLKERFGSIPLRQIVSMKSKYSIRLIEILYFSSHGLKKKVLYFSVDDLKKRLGLKQTNETIDPFQEKYINFKDFNREVLERAKREFLERSPIIFTYELEKSGRKVIGLYFYIEKNSNKKTIELPKNIDGGLLELESKVNGIELSEPPVNKQKQKEEPLNIDKELYDKLINHGLKQVQILEFLNNPDIGLNGIEEGFQYYLKQLDEGKINKNKPAYLYNSINKKWGERTEEQKKDDEKEEFNKLLIKKQDMFENYERYGLNRNDLVNLKSEIVDMFKKIGNHSGVSIWENKDVDYVMR